MPKKRKQIQLATASALKPTPAMLSIVPLYRCRFDPISSSAVSQTASVNSRNPLIALLTAQDRQFSRVRPVFASILSLWNLLKETWQGDRRFIVLDSLVRRNLGLDSI